MATTERPEHSSMSPMATHTWDYRDGMGVLRCSFCGASWVTTLLISTGVLVRYEGLDEGNPRVIRERSEGED